MAITEQMTSLIQLCIRLEDNIKSISDDVSAVQKQVHQIHSDANIVKIDLEVIKKSNNLNKFELLESRAESLKNEIHRIDLMLNGLKIFADSSQQRWSKTIDMGYKIANTIVLAYILYLFGLDGVNIP